MTMATVGELIHSLDKVKVLEALARLHQGDGEDPEGYSEVWDKLLAMQPQLSEISVSLSQTWSCDEPPEPVIDISGVQEGDPTKWAIEFMAWEAWLSMPIIVDEELQPMPPEDQLAHCLYEMTWPGYTQEVIEDKFSDILESVEDVKRMIDDEPKH